MDKKSNTFPSLWKPKNHKTFNNGLRAYLLIYVRQLFAFTFEIRIKSLNKYFLVGKPIVNTMEF